MKTQSHGRSRLLPPPHLLSLFTSPRGLPSLFCSLSLLRASTLKDYREQRENGDKRDNPKEVFPAAGFDGLDIVSSDALDWSNKWPDKEGRYWWRLTCKDGHEINDFYWMKDYGRGFPDANHNYWFIVHHAPSGWFATHTKIEGFSVRQDREKGYPDKDRNYCSYVQYDECGPIKQWMEEKDRNYVARLKREEQQANAAAQRAAEEKQRQEQTAEQLRLAERKRLEDIRKAQDAREKDTAQIQRLEESRIAVKKAQALVAFEKKALEQERLRTEQEKRQIKTQALGRRDALQRSICFAYFTRRVIATYVIPGLAVGPLKYYREQRENGDNIDNPKEAFPAAGFDGLDIVSSVALDWSDKWPDKEGRYWWKLKCKDGREINDFYWMQDNVRGFPDNADGDRYWFTIHHAPSGTKIESFSQRPDRQKGYPDKDGDYWSYIQYDECGPIQQWMEEKYRNYVARLQREEQQANAAVERERRAVEEKPRQEQAAEQQLRLAKIKRLEDIEIKRLEDIRKAHEAREKDAAQIKQLEQAKLDAQKAQSLAAAEKEALAQERLRAEQEKNQLAEQRRLLQEAQAKKPSTTVRATEAMQTVDYPDLEFIQEIAAGSFGKVWLGKWMGTPVAIKKPHGGEPAAVHDNDAALRGLNEMYKKSLRDEVFMMAKLHHPNVVKLYGVVTQPEFCVVIELMTKGSLHSLLNSTEPLAWPLRHRIGFDIAQGLRYLHRSNVLHRDLKSPNILLDNEYRAKLSDYGTSKYGTSYTAQSLYSPFWLAPELLLLMINPGSKATVTYTQACDVYSFAIVLWELASRKEPRYISPHELMTGKRQAIPADTPPSMARLIAHCWAKKPEDRLAMDAVVLDMQVTVANDDFTPKPSTPIAQGASSRGGSSGSSYSSGPSSSLSSGLGFFQIAEEEEPLPEEPPEELVIAQAKHTYQAKKPNQLSFNKGDELIVLKQQGNWWLCECSNMQGLVPKNYLTILSQQDQQPASFRSGYSAASLS